MGIQANNGRVSDAYIGTFNYESSDDMFQLQDLRTMVKHMNRDLRAANMEYQFYVKCQGRSNTIKRSGKFDMSMPLDVADRVDAYIYRRNLL